MAARERERRCLRRREHWVVFPQRSTPSRRMNVPRFMAVVDGGGVSIVWMDGGGCCGWRWVEGCCVLYGLTSRFVRFLNSKHSSTVI